MRKKLKNMKKDELVEYANSCPGVKVNMKMTKSQIMTLIPWKFKDHNPEDIEPPEAFDEQPEIEEKPQEPQPTLMPLRDALLVKNNWQLRKYISMDGKYRTGLSEEKIERANQIMDRLKCERPKKEK